MHVNTGYQERGLALARRFERVFADAKVPPKPQHTAASPSSTRSIPTGWGWRTSAPRSPAGRSTWVLACRKRAAKSPDADEPGTPVR
jgi:hypothetical protein